jgi:hypothetical protein
MNATVVSPQQRLAVEFSADESIFIPLIHREVPLPPPSPKVQVYASIMIVDDSVLNLIGIKAQLNCIQEIKNDSLSIDEALDGEEAIELF